MPPKPAPQLTLPELSPLLSTCRNAIADQWDDDCEETIALVDKIDDLLATPPDQIKIWTGVVDSHSCETKLYAATSLSALYAQVAVFCTEYWYETGEGTAPDPCLSPQDIVEAYFAAQADSGDEWFVIEEVVLASAS